MQRYIYIKPIDHIQLGHLYEHIYYAQLVAYFHSKSLYAYIDYAIDAKTDYAGFIRLEVTMYTSVALREARAIPAIEITFDDDTINAALLQILAEKYADVGVLDTAFVHKKLVSYQRAPWLALETLDMHDIPPRRLSRSGFRLINRHERHFRMLKQTISIDTATLQTRGNPSVAAICCH